jgi:glycosyltransferase involved in cell wall biosynthesis
VIRICLVSSYPPVQTGESTYVQSYAYALQTYLDKEITEIHILSHLDGMRKELNNTDGNKIRIYRLFDSNKFLSKNLGFLKIFGKIREIHPDLVHFHYPPIPKSRFGGLLGEPLLILFLLLKVTRIPFFVTLHSIWYPDEVEKRAYELSGNKMLSKLAKHHFKMLMYFFGILPEKLFIMVSSKNSKLTQAFSDAYHIPPKKLKEELHGLSRMDELSKSGPERDSKRIVCLGFIVPNKGYSYVVMAMKKVLEKIPDASLVIAGSTFSQEGKQYFKHLHNMVSDNSLEKSIKLEERYLSQNEFTEYIKGAGIVIVPYLRVLGVSGIMTLAISYKVPVIATCSGALFEEISDIVSVIPPRNDRAIADEIIRILGSKEYRSRITSNYEKYIADHDWAVVARENYKEYLSLKHHVQDDIGSNY